MFKMEKDFEICIEVWKKWSLELRHGGATTGHRAGILNLADEERRE